MRSSFAPAPFVIALLLAASAPAAEVSYAGKYSDGNLIADFTNAAGGYSGMVTLGSQQFPASAHSNGHGLDGSFSASGSDFRFTATLDADVLTLTSGGKTYSLKKISPPANPLAQGSSTPTNTDVPAGYTVEVASDSGKSLVIQKPKATSIKTALEATFPDLAAYFGARPTIGSAYQDAKDPTSGGATFSSNLNGHPVRGLVSCKIHDGGGATVAVVYGRTDATKDGWNKLLNPPATATAAGTPAVDGAASDPNIPLRAYDFPDGTGTVGLAEGWSTKAQTCIHTVAIVGPADQAVILGNAITIQTPDSPMVKMMEHNQAMMEQMQARNARMGLRTTPLPAVPPTMIAPMMDPVDAVKNLIPQFSKRSEFAHGPSFALDEIISNTDFPTELQGGKGADITYTLTRTLKGETVHLRSKLHLQTCPIGDTAWMWFGTSMQAPDATFERDLPAMAAMVKSFKINKDRATEVSNAENENIRQMTNQMARQSQQNLENNARQFQQDQDRRFAIGQEQHAAQEQGYAQHNQQWQRDELQKSRNNADFVETIKGTRTIYDTQTGATGTADLNYVNGVVDSLNTAALDPNRFVQIPLRDEMYPVK